METLPRHTPKYLAIFRLFHIPTLTGFCFSSMPVKKSLRSPSLAPISPQHHFQTSHSCHPSFQDFPLVQSAATIAACAQGKLLLWFFFIVLGSASVELLGEALAPHAHHGDDGADSATHICCPALCDRVRISHILFPEIKWHPADQKRLAVFAVGVTASLVSSSVSPLPAKIAVWLIHGVAHYFLKVPVRSFTLLLFGLIEMIDFFSFCRPDTVLFYDWVISFVDPCYFWSRELISLTFDPLSFRLDDEVELVSALPFHFPISPPSLINR